MLALLKGFARISAPVTIGTQGTKVQTDLGNRGLGRKSDSLLTAYKPDDHNTGQRGNYAENAERAVGQRKHCRQTAFGGERKGSEAHPLYREDKAERDEKIRHRGDAALPCWSIRAIHLAGDVTAARASCGLDSGANALACASG